MRKLVTAVTVLVLLVFVFTCNVYAGKSKQRMYASRGDFRVTVHTNKLIYHNRDVLRLAVQLLNDSPKAVHISRNEASAPVNDPEDDETGEIFEGVLDGVDVDVQINESCPIIIGYATLIPLGPSPVACEDQIPIPKRVFRLPLFGSTIIPAHSTRYISTANVLIACPFVTEDIEACPTDVEPFEISEVEEIEMISAERRYIALRPGYYLLDCHINKIYGTKLAKAQKIIQIRRRICPPAFLEKLE